MHYVRSVAGLPLTGGHGGVVVCGGRRRGEEGGEDEELDELVHGDVWEEGPTSTGVLDKCAAVTMYPHKGCSIILCRISICIVRAAFCIFCQKAITWY